MNFALKTKAPPQGDAIYQRYININYLYFS